jgi:hypothetical protein
MNFNGLLMSPRSLTRLIVLFGAGGLLVGATTAVSSAQSVETPTIRVETREVVLPVQVIEEKKDPKGLLIGPDDNEQHVYLLRRRELAGLSATSFHIFEDGVEQVIKHFSLEKDHLWLVRDNKGQHMEYSCTPKGIWTGSDKQNIPFDESLRLHTYLLAYTPPSSPAGSCHRITIKVKNKHAKIYAPDQYCNTKEPLSDPLNGASLGEKLLEKTSSKESSTLPLTFQSIPFGNSSGTYRVNISVATPASLLERKWEGIHLSASIAILGLVYGNKDNALAYRFSDVACTPSESNVEFNGPLPPGNSQIELIPGSHKYWEDLTIPTTYQTQIDLGPGDYRLELLLTDGEKFGRATASLKLQDLVKDGLRISGIALCRRYRPASVEPRSPSQAPQYVPLVFNVTEFTPAGDARFHKGELLNSFFEIYGPELEDPAAAFQLHVRIADAKTGEIKLDSGSEPLKFSTPPKNHSASVVRDVSIDVLPPGFYHLEAQVTDSEGHKTAWSSASFTVE